MTTRQSWAGATLLAIAAVAIIAIFRKGLWYDEAWSLFLARNPGRWLYDAHPPLFFGLSALFAPGNAVAGRLLNLLYLAVAGVAAFALGRRRPRSRFPLLVAAVIMLANPLALYAVIDFRSYALLLATWGSAVASMLVIAWDEGDFERTDWPAAAIGGLGIIAALNLHYVSSLLVGTMLGVFILWEWRQGRRRWAAIHFAAGTLGSAMLLATVSVHWPHLVEIGQLEWSRSNFGAVKVVTGVLGLLLGANLVAVIAALRRWPAKEELRFALICLMALAAAGIVAITLNAIHGMLLTRYLMALVPVAAAAVGSLASPNLGKRLYPAFLANALGVASVYLLVDARQNWNALGREIASISDGCETTQIVAVQSWRMAGFKSYPLKDDKAALQLGYELIGAKYGFDPTMAGKSVRAGACPVVVWAEHYSFPLPSPEEIAARAQVSGRFEEIRRSKTGFIAIFR